MPVYLSRRLTALAATLVLGLAAAAGAEALPTVVITGDPVAPSPAQPGTGLCMTGRISTNPDADIPGNAAGLNAGVNAFLETAPSAANPNARVTSVLRKPFDLSNNNTSGLKQSYGDFENAVAGCPTGGCDFFVTDSAVSFAVRLRAYLNVTADMVGLPVHFGFYADDAVALTLYDRQSNAYRVTNLSAPRGAATWRTTNSVTFLKPGLYSAEVLYGEITEHAALEMSVFVGTFTDYERPVGQAPVVKLNSAGFALVAPTSFYQTETGLPSYSTDLNKCAQCNRQYANTAGNNGCDPAYYCNGAALCAPCDSAVFCGPSCSPCGLSTPECINRNGTYTCVQCSTDDQCPNGRCDPDTNQCRGCRTDSNCPSGQHCDPEQRECVECLEDSQCGRGESCSSHTCQPCSSQDHCAGTSCNCCPNGLQCGSPTPGASPTCVECTDDSQCSDGKRCDRSNGRCVAQLTECNTSERCGDQCVKCPSERAYCLDGQVCVECRSDLECGDGKYCLSGECASCITDKRCGARCGACPTDTPYCLTDGTVRGSSCAGCRDNSDCGPGGSCNPTTHTCAATTCSLTCATGTVCYGDSCVACFTDAHCPCGGTCDTATHTCNTSCNSSADCIGAQFCSPTTQQCEPGRRKPGTEPQGGAPCCGATGDAPPQTLALLVLVALGLSLRSRGAA